MGDTLEIWRARIGCFSSCNILRSKSKCFNSLTLKVELSNFDWVLTRKLVMIVSLLLIISGDVECNPGPTLLNRDIVECSVKYGRDCCIEKIKTAIATSGNSLPTDNAIIRSIDKCLSVHSTKKKSSHRLSGKAALEDFMNQDFPIPKRSGPYHKTIGNTGHSATPETYQVVASKLAQELSSKFSELQASESKNKEISEENDLLQENLGHAKLELKKLDKISSNNEMLVNQNMSLKRESEINASLLTDKRKELKRVLAREKYYKEKVSRMERQESQVVPDDVSVPPTSHEADQLEEELIDALDENRNLKHQIRMLQSEVKDLKYELSKTEIVTCDENGRYTTDMQQCVFSLLKHHVSTIHVSSVISIVLKLAGKTAAKLPSVSTINNMNVQRLIIAQKQLGESVRSTDDTCLYTDETTKFGEKYGGYHLSNQDGNMLVLGLRTLPTKSSSDTLSVFRDIMDDIDLVCNSTNNEKSLSIFTSIKATMSDRAATEMKFNSLLEDYRKSILPLTLENYSNFSESEKLSVDRLYNFFCGLHPLIHFADAANASMKEAEQGFYPGEVPIYDPSFKKGDEAAVARLVRTSCKAVARGADEKSGCYSPFKTFIFSQLKLDGLHSVPLQPYRGNRFNILFSNAAGLFYLHSYLSDFLKHYELNRLLRSVNHDLQEPFLLAGCKALGLISYMVMAPLWRFVEAKDVHITDMNERYHQLVSFFNDATINTEDFVAGNLLPFGQDTCISRDAIYNSLSSPWIHDSYVVTILKILFPAFSTLSSKLYADHLPDGKYFNLTVEAKNKTRCVQKHNKFAEMAFAYLDQLLRFKPNIKSLASEAYLMFCCNKTEQWLQNKSKVEIDSLLHDARRQVKFTREKFKTRQKEIHQRRLEMIQEKAKKYEELERKKLKQKENMTNEIIYFGLWQSETEVDQKLLLISSKSEKEKALKAQIRFREKVLEQKMDKSLSCFSHKINDKRVPLSVDNLRDNVKQLIINAFTLPSTSARNAPTSLPVLVGKQVQHKFDNGVWYNGKVISQVSLFKFSNVFLL